RVTGSRRRDRKTSGQKISQRAYNHAAVERRAAVHPLEPTSMKSTIQPARSATRLLLAASVIALALSGCDCNSGKPHPDGGGGGTGGTGGHQGGGNGGGGGNNGGGGGGGNIGGGNGGGGADPN